MRFAISIPQFVADGRFDPAGFHAYMARAEALGFDSAWTQEQVLGTMPTLGPTETMTYAAACTERIRLGCVVFVTPLHNPVHLLGVEAAASILAAVREKRSTGGAEIVQGYDLVARASRALPAGTSLALGPRHVLPGADPELVPARALAPDAPVPYYLAAGCRLARDVAEGALLTLGDLDPVADSTLLRLRQEQDALLRTQG